MTHHRKHPRVLFVLKYRSSPYSIDGGQFTYSSGSDLSSGLLNSSRFVAQMLHREGFKTHLVQVIDSNSIEKEIAHFRADVVIIEAYFVLPKKFDELKKVCPNVLFVVRNHSELPFLSNEGMSMDYTLEYAKRTNVVMSCNSQESFNDIRFLAENQEGGSVNEVQLLPNYYPLHQRHPVIRKASNPLNIGCFGAIRPLKNQLLQAAAAMIYANRNGVGLNFHMNGTRIEMYGTPILKNILLLFNHFPQFTLMLHDWTPHHEFIKLVRQMDLVMQVSFSESFNIVAADATMCGVPIVVSKEIKWASHRFQASTTSSDDIVSKIGAALTSPVRHNLDGLHHYNEVSVCRWVEFLENL